MGKRYFISKTLKYIGHNNYVGEALLSRVKIPSFTPLKMMRDSSWNKFQNKDKPKFFTDEYSQDKKQNQMFSSHSQTMFKNTGISST